MSDYYKSVLSESGGDPNPPSEQQPTVTFALIAGNTLLWVIIELIGSSQDPEMLLRFGALAGLYVADGDYWRLLTAMFLHAGIMHLLFNTFGLFIFGRTVEQIYGSLRFSLIYFIAGLSGSVSSFIMSPNSIGVGASGAIFGVLGSFAAFFLVRRHIFGALGKQNLYGILVLAAINLFFGLITPGIDNWAHMGGFAAGFFVGYILVPKFPVKVSFFGQTQEVVNERPVARILLTVSVAAILLSSGVALGRAFVGINPITQIRKAEDDLNNKNYVVALDNINRALELDPYSAKSYFVRGKLYAVLGNKHSARIDLARSLQMGLSGDDRQEARSLLVSMEMSY